MDDKELISKIVYYGGLSVVSFPLFPLGMMFLFCYSCDAKGESSRAYSSSPKTKNKNLFLGISSISVGLLLTPWSLHYLMRPLLHSVIVPNIANSICSKEFPAFNIKNNLIWISSYVIPITAAYNYVKYLL